MLLTNWSQKPDLEAYGAPGGTVVFVLIVKLQMRNQQLVHSTGVTGRQTVQFTLETDTPSLQLLQRVIVSDRSEEVLQYLEDVQQTQDGGPDVLHGRLHRQLSLSLHRAG